YAHVIASGSEEEKIHAAEKLAEMGSPRAVAWVLDEIGVELKKGMRRAETGVSIGGAETLLGNRGLALVATLIRTGPRALPTLIRAFARRGAEGEEPPATWLAAIFTLGKMEPELFSRPGGTGEEALKRALRLLSEDPSRPAEVHGAAAETLQILLQNPSEQPR